MIRAFLKSIGPAAGVVLALCTFCAAQDISGTGGSPRSEIRFTYAVDSLTNGYGDWHTAAVDFSYRGKPRQVFYGTLLATKRFGQHDRQVTLGVYQPLSRKWSLQLEASASPTQRILSKWSGFAGLERSFKKGWNAQGGFRRTVYREAKVNTANAGVEKYFGNNRVAYALYITSLGAGRTSASHRVQFNRYYGENSSSVGFTGGFGREIEVLGDRSVVQTSVAGGGISGNHWINGRWGVSYDASLTRQGTYYVRRGASIGIRYRF